jgi:hypothetical protein
MIQWGLYPPTELEGVIMNCDEFSSHLSKWETSSSTWLNKKYSCFYLIFMLCYFSVVILGGVFERFKDPVLKTGDPARGPWVRIPPPPPYMRS